jgi:hypothetical protein
MAILNYTTSISTEKTAAEIQKKLAMAGAQAVLSEYDENGIMCAMSFRINNISFRLPINIDGVYSALCADKKVPRRFATYEQASRVAWRIIKDWIEAQIAIIQAGQAELVQVFLPYAQNHEGKTVYEAIKDCGFKQITFEGIQNANRRE